MRNTRVASEKAEFPHSERGQIPDEAWGSGQALGEHCRLIGSEAQGPEQAWGPTETASVEELGLRFSQT